MFHISKHRAFLFFSMGFVLKYTGSAPAEGPVGCFPLSAFTNHGPGIPLVHLTFHIQTYLQDISRSAATESTMQVKCSYSLNFDRDEQFALQRGSINSQEQYPEGHFSISSPIQWVIMVYRSRAYRRNIVLSLCGFHLHFGYQEWEWLCFLADL